MSQRGKENSMMHEELLAKGVKVVNFYDVVLDLMLLEAFELLANPPSQVLTVTRHRWLSNDFKRCTLDSTVWTVLLAKRKLLKYPEGFYAHYYSVVGTLLPALAWGFLGPDENLLRICNRFREVVTKFVQESFICCGKSINNHISDLPDVESSIVCTDSDVDGGSHLTLNNHDYSHSEDDLHISHDVNNETQTDMLHNYNETCTGSSTLIASDDQNFSFPNASTNSRQIGLRYTNLTELASDLYDLMALYVTELRNVLIEESSQLDNPLPLHVQDNPPRPALHSNS